MDSPQYMLSTWAGLWALGVLGLVLVLALFTPGAPPSAP